LGLTTTVDTRQLLQAPETFLSHMQHDKKNEGGALTLILTRAIGQAFVQKGASTQDVLAYLQDLKEALG
jgi:3-dehydroquinate synthase